MTALLFLVVSSLAAITAAGEPSTPANDEEPLERLPRGAARVGDALRARSMDSSSALRLARKYVRLGAEEADPRYFGYAAAALAPIWRLAAPPAEARLLRAMILQNRHDFDGARADLDAVFAVDPGNLQAWLMRASISKLQGRFDDARASCAPLVAAKDPLLAVGCVSDVASVDGAVDEAADALERVLEERASAPAERRRWALTLLAEIAARRGRSDHAERRFTEALQIAKPSAYLLAAYADFLLDEARFADASALLAEATRMDAALLRLALAERRLGSPRLREHIVELSERFAAGRRRGEALHLGDEARFALYLAGDRAEALRLAQTNWRVQRAPSDARILLEAASASDADESAREARAFLLRAGWDESRLARVVEAARAAAAPIAGR
ncbi:hypothetical protein CQW49_17255 [Methylosinus trichosporium OB3b]|uniref:Tetratricopeptide repeat protein n=2 Tax=Methylocystaceae TaxID=31993 RepID=A0A2D2D354_METT3|nr:hypothetical protein CQW49_17255 [Methylosinus trichosporium OB3b]